MFSVLEFAQLLAVGKNWLLTTNSTTFLRFVYYTADQESRVDMANPVAASKILLAVHHPQERRQINRKLGLVGANWQLLEASDGGGLSPAMDGC